MLTIQPNYFTKISFKQEENKPQLEDNSSEHQGMSKNQKIATGVVTAAVALAGLGYLGYKGHLGKGIQKFLGGAEDAVKNSNTNLKDSGKKEPHKFLTPEEFDKLSAPEQATRFMADVDVIEKEAGSLEEAYTKIREDVDKFGDEDYYNASLYEALYERVLSKYQTVLPKLEDQFNLRDIKTALACIKLIKQEYASAEKYALEVISDKMASMDVYITSLRVFYEASKAQGKKAQAEKLFDKEVTKIINEFNSLKQQNQDTSKFKEYLIDIYDNLKDVYGADNTAIQVLSQIVG